jgi:hypothetical protein
MRTRLAQRASKGQEPSRFRQYDHARTDHFDEGALSAVHALEYFLCDEAAVLMTVQLGPQNLAGFGQGYFHFDNGPLVESIRNRRRNASNRPYFKHIHRHDDLPLY